MKNISKESLILENAIFKNRIDHLEKESQRLRENFTELLNYHNTGFSYEGNLNKFLKTLSWEAIYFCIGSLKSDAEYSLVLESKFHLQGEFDRANQEIAKLKNPPPEKNSK